MITEMEYVKRMLTIGGYTLVLCEGGRAFTSEENGIEPLLETAKSGEDWTNAFASVKTLGRAEALLFMYLGVKGVYAETASKPAVRLLKQNGIQTEFNACVPNLLNEDKTGLRETEQAVAQTEEPSEALKALENIF